MKNISELLTNYFTAAYYTGFPENAGHPVVIDVVQSTQDKFGHYQFNSAMRLSKELKLPPRQIAEKIMQHVERTLPDNTPFIAGLEIAGPGFVNITLSQKFLSRGVMQMLMDSHLGVEVQRPPQRIVVDFSSPNTAKEMHVGHLRSTIIGDCLARLFEFFGDNVLRLNHIGDWGTSFGMLIAYMKREAPDVLDAHMNTDLSHLVKWYRESKKKFDEDPLFKKAAQLEVVSLQGGDSASLKSWHIICEISRKAHQEIYDLLGVKLIERGESFYNPLLADTVADLESKQLVTLSDGAKCIYLEGFQNRTGESLPLMIQKSDGAYNYDTTDMAALRHRIEVEKADRIIYVVDAGQSTHFQMIFQAAKLAGYLKPPVLAEHVPFGLVLGADGKKFRTRAGSTEKLIDLLQAAVDEADTILQERSPEMPPDERKALARALGISAIKYADLSSHRASDYTFSYERMLKFEGNTAAFLMYAYVRTTGIKRKVGLDPKVVAKNTAIELEHPSEIALGVHLLRFGEALNQVAVELLPNRLTDYLYNLAEKFNAFFRDCRVEGSDRQSERLLLCEVTARVLKQGLTILGLDVVEKM